MFRWAARAVIGLLVLAVLAVVAVLHLIMRSLPEYDATHEVAGIQQPVEIVRDRHNVPHIFAENDEDVFFGLGFVHAQDRLWQMEMLRRTAQGRLSEIFGERTLGHDILMRSLRLYRFAALSVSAQDSETRDALRAYAAGVNAWIKIVQRDALGRGAPEFLLFRNSIEQWSPADSISVLNLQAWLLSEHLEDEVLRERIANKLSRDDVSEILPDGPGILDKPFAYQLYSDWTSNLNRTREDLSPKTPASPGGGGPGGASNAWSVAPSKAINKKSMLANDPHLPFSAPSIWMLARLGLTAGDVIGGTIPGSPVVPVGRSKNLAWGLTYAFVDNQDLYFEKIDPDDSDYYAAPGGREKFQIFSELIEIEGKDPIRMELKWTENGPVLPEDSYNLAEIVPDGHAAALAWSMLHPMNLSMTAAYRLMQAASVGEALEAARDYRSPPMNMFVVDEDEIAMQLIGAVPMRHPFHETLGRTPSAGWKRINRWIGEFPYEANPGIRNPEIGLLGNTNNKSVDRPFPGHISFRWGDTQRIQRLKELVKDRNAHTLDSFRETQLDVMSVTATTLVSLVARDLWHTVEGVPGNDAERLRFEAIDRLGEWDGRMDELSPEPLIYAEWMRELYSSLLKDDLEEIFEDMEHPDPVFIERVFRDVDGASAWCDYRQSQATESCSVVAEDSLDNALSKLSSKYGSDIGEWRWGNAHQAEHKHPVLGDNNLFSWFVNIYQPISGGDNTLNRSVASGDEDNPHASRHGPGYRGVYDLSDPDSSLFIISTGQSGHFLSPHYDDLSTLWRKGEYLTMSLNPDQARSDPVGITNLAPISAK